MGVLRSCYTGPCRFKIDGPVSSIRYYFARPDAQVYLKPHVFFPLSQTLQHKPTTGVGELWTGRYPWSAGRLPSGPKGDAVDGTEEDFRGESVYTGPVAWTNVPECRWPILITLHVRRPNPPRFVAMAFSAEGDWAHRRGLIGVRARTEFPPLASGIAFAGEGPLTLAHPPRLQMLATSAPMIDPSRTLDIGLRAGSVPGWSKASPIHIGVFTTTVEERNVASLAMGYRAAAANAYPSGYAGPFAIAAQTTMIDDGPRKGFVGWTALSSHVESRRASLAFGSYRVPTFEGLFPATVLFVAETDSGFEVGATLAFSSDAGDANDFDLSISLAFDAIRTDAMPDPPPTPGLACDSAGVMSFDTDYTYDIAAFANQWFKVAITPGATFHITFTDNTAVLVGYSCATGTSCGSNTPQFVNATHPCNSFTAGGGDTWCFIHVTGDFFAAGNYTIRIGSGACP